MRLSKIIARTFAMSLAKKCYETLIEEGELAKLAAEAHVCTGRDIWYAFLYYEESSSYKIKTLR